MFREWCDGNFVFAEMPGNQQRKYDLRPRGDSTMVVDEVVSEKLREAVTYITECKSFFDIAIFFPVAVTIRHLLLLLLLLLLQKKCSTRQIFNRVIRSVKQLTSLPFTVAWACGVLLLLSLWL